MRNQHEGSARIIGSIDDHVDEVYDESPDAVDDQLQMALLAHVHEQCTKNPGLAASRFGLPHSLVKKISAMPSSEFFLRMGRSQKLVFSLAPSARVMEAALTDSNQSRASAHLITSSYAESYKQALKRGK